MYISIFILLFLNFLAFWRRSDAVVGTCSPSASSDAACVRAAPGRWGLQQQGEQLAARYRAAARPAAARACCACARRPPLGRRALRRTTRRRASGDADARRGLTTAQAMEGDALYEEMKETWGARAARGMRTCSRGKETLADGAAPRGTRVPVEELHHPGAGSAWSRQRKVSPWWLGRPRLLDGCAMKGHPGQSV